MTKGNLEQASEKYAEQRGAYEEGYGIETTLAFESGACWQREVTRQHAGRSMQTDVSF